MTERFEVDDRAAQGAKTGRQLAQSYDRRAARQHRGPDEQIARI